MSKLRLQFELLFYGNFGMVDGIGFAKALCFAEGCQGTGGSILLWFPDKESERKVFTTIADNDSGYALSNIELSTPMQEYKLLVDEEFEHNCFEKEFSFFKEGYWMIGIIDCRHLEHISFPTAGKILRNDVRN